MLKGRLLQSLLLLQEREAAGAVALKPLVLLGSSLQREAVGVMLIGTHKAG